VDVLPSLKTVPYRGTIWFWGGKKNKGREGQKRGSLALLEGEEQCTYKQNAASPERGRKNSFCREGKTTNRFPSAHQRKKNFAVLQGGGGWTAHLEKGGRREKEKTARGENVKVETMPRPQGGL